MRNTNYERIGLMLDYINSTEEKVEALELIGKFLPSLYELNIVYNKTLKGAYHNIRIDMQSKELKGAIRKAYELKNELDYCEEMIVRYLEENENKRKEDVSN